MTEYQGPERRRFVRVPFIFPVKYNLMGDDEKKEYHGLSDNLSEGGIKIICMHKINVGDDVSISFSLPTSDGIVNICCKGCVAWYRESDNRNFCGVQFQSLQEEQQIVLHNFIKRILEFRGVED